MSTSSKPLVWLRPDSRPTTPPLSDAARREMGGLLRMVQLGLSIALPHSRPMPSIGPRCHELRVRDENRNWRLVYRIDDDAIVVAAMFAKTTQKTPKRDLDVCRARLKAYDDAGGD